MYDPALTTYMHQPFIDAILILASLKRPVRFVMNREMFSLPVINTLCRALRVIPVDLKAGPKAIVAALNNARSAIQQGELVCIFPEGHLTRTGNMLPFQRGFEFIVKNTLAPIIPLYLDNIWGSIFSYYYIMFFYLDLFI